MVRSTINKFTPEQWVSGISWFQVPARVAYHTVECLDAYFWVDSGGEFKWGYRFGTPGWELSDREQPTQEELLAYLADIEAKIVQHFAPIEDADLVTPHNEQRKHAKTRLGHHVYALRHTMHHHGALTLLSIHHGNEGGSWA